MRRVELSGLVLKSVDWDPLLAEVPATFEGLGLTPTSGSGDLSVELLDRGDQGRVLVVDDLALAKRAGLALAKKHAVPVGIFEVVGTVGKVFRFRTEAFTATPGGELKPSEGKELDLEPSGGWIGPLDEQAMQVLAAFAGLDYGASRSERFGFKKRKLTKPESPRVAALLKQLEKARTHEAVTQPDGRIELRIELAAGGKQRSFCSAAEYDELKAFIGA